MVFKAVDAFVVPAAEVSQTSAISCVLPSVVVKLEIKPTVFPLLAWLTAVAFKLSDSMFNCASVKSVPVGVVPLAPPTPVSTQTSSWLNIGSLESITSRPLLANAESAANPLAAV